MRVLITGSRDWPDDGTIDKVLSEYLAPWSYQGSGGANPTIIDGKCPYGGADQIAHEWAVKNGYNTERYDADDFGNKGDNSRFYRRNKHMVDLGADVCYAFVLGKSRGTEMTIQLARDAGIEVRAIYRSK